MVIPGPDRVFELRYWIALSGLVLDLQASIDDKILNQAVGIQFECDSRLLHRSRQFGLLLNDDVLTVGERERVCTWPAQDKAPLKRTPSIRTAGIVLLKIGEV